jgi:hypothetical protein
MDPAVVSLIRALGNAMVVSALAYLVLGLLVRRGLRRTILDPDRRALVHTVVSLLAFAVIFGYAIASL